MNFDFPQDWAITKLSNCATFQEGYVNPSQSVQEYFGEDIKWLRANDLNNSYVHNTSRKLSKKGFESAGKSAILFEPNSIAISKSGTIGRLGILKDYMCGNRAVINIKVNRGEYDNLFIFYSILIRRELLESLASGSVQKNLYISVLGNLEIAAPPLPEQRAIAHILGTLDDKIENNRRMNATLEAMAQALFKSWFVDFDPVRAKAEGREPEGMDAATAALFPDRLVDSELGEMPEGWEVKNLFDFAEYINGVAYRKVDFSPDDSGLPIVKIAEIKNGITSQTKFTNREMDAKYRIDDGEILFSWSGSPDTSIGTFLWTNGPGWLNQHIFRVLPHHEEERYFLFFLLRYLNPEFIEIARDKQTTGLGHVTQKDIKRINITLPDDTILEAFNKLAAPIFSQVLSSFLESKNLTALRDTLLPKLISGELRVPEAEDMMEDTV